MAMNLRNPIQLLRGTGRDIASQTGKEGALYFDTETGTLLVHNGSELNILTRVFNDPILSPTIYVDAENGDDSNYGFSESAPVKTFDRALVLTNVVNSVFISNIKLAAGTYITEVKEVPNCIIMGDSMDTTFINMPYFKNESKYVSVNNVTITASSVDNNTIAFSSYEGTLHFINTRLRASGDVNAILYGGDNSYVYISHVELDMTNVNGRSLIYSNFSSAINLYDLHIRGNVTVDYTVFALGNSYIFIDPNGPIVNHGTVTGSRYRAAYGSVIATDGQGATAIPGTSDGTVAGNGYYY